MRLAPMQGIHPPAVFGDAETTKTGAGRWLAVGAVATVAPAGSPGYRPGSLMSWAGRWLPASR